MSLGAKYILPVHDRPAVVEGGAVVGRADMEIAGPITQSVPRRNWVPA